MTTTSRPRRPHLDTVRRRVDRWRQRRPHARARLPPELWAAAVALVPEHGLYGTARALRLDYGTLKRHVDGRQAASGAVGRRGFIELPAASVADAATIEITCPGGPTVRVRLPGRPLSAIAEFARRVAGARA